VNETDQKLEPIEKLPASAPESEAEESAESKPSESED